MEKIVSLGVTTPGVVFIQGGEKQAEYEIPLPEGWKEVRHNENIGLCGALRWAFNQHPQALWYGWLEDEVMPVTEKFDIPLIEAAGKWKISHTNDNWGSYNQISGISVFGGDLVRAVGSLAPEGLWHRYIDNYWETINHSFNVRVECKQVLCVNRCWSDGTHHAIRDETYHVGHSRDAEDKAWFLNWRDKEWPDMQKRLREVIPA